LSIMQQPQIKTNLQQPKLVCRAFPNYSSVIVIGVFHITWQVTIGLGDVGGFENRPPGTAAD